MRKLSFTLAVVVLTACAAVSRYYDPAKPHHTREGFQNRYPHDYQGDGFWRWQWDRLGKKLPPPELDLSPVAPDLALLNSPAAEIPTVQADELQAVQHTVSASAPIALTWIGHATVLYQVAGKRLLFDPIFSERSSPVSFIGPRRWQPPGVALAQLPHIDAVFISHNHYDHLDLPSVQALQKQAGGGPQFFVPLGLASWFADNVPGAQVKEMDWDDQTQFDSLTIGFTAVQHWSSREVIDRNESLWGGWAVLHPSFRFWFSGDLGYSKDTQDIGNRFGSFDLAAIAIGAYEPEWFMHAQHVTPAQAVQVMQDIHARQAVGVHWGTFALSDEPLDQPPRDLAAALAKAGMNSEQFFVLRHGESRRFTPQRTATHDATECAKTQC
ncbi:MBL fold metallo-hydrolase [Ampullimonas aquatilis]|uniref:MBL fold metallo-hydrolase n=1 Tax=Ampullimonas aquatilis TaxID=1341549 RepID=UPI003C76222B